jgi:predicted nucleotidyltransferase
MLRYPGLMDLRRPLAVITPTLDGDVLTVLAGGDVRFSGRQISRLIGASQEGVRHVLDRLVTEGIVLREKAGNAHLYQLNRRHLAAPWIERLSALRSDLIDRLRAKVTGWSLAPRVALLFGSTARGDTTATSDIDVAIVRPAGTDPENPAWRHQISDLAKSVKAMTGNDVRVVEYSEAEARRMARTDKLLIAAAAEGIELVGSLRTMLARSRRAKVRS